MNKVFGVVFIVLAVAIAVVPMFTDCQSQGGVITLQNGKTIPMKCHWTGVAELGVGIPLAAVGAMMVASRRKESRTYLSIAGIALAGIVLALPLQLIGTCTTPTMVCNTAMKPALLSLGGVALAASVLGLVISTRSKDPW